MKKNKVLYYSVLVVLIGVFVFSAYKLGAYWMEKVRSDQMMDEASQFVDVGGNQNDENDANSGSDEQGDDPNTGDPEQIEVDFAAMAELSDDIVAWIYCPNTQINYPIVQGYDNDYYLYRLLDGTWNANGTIFMDYRNEDDFSDYNTMIYGHHMKTGAMFADLMKYKSQSYYEEHPYMYIYTPEQNYRLDLFAGTVVDCIADIYSYEPSSAVLNDCISRSTFDATLDYPANRIVTQSTCTYEYDDARYVVLGDLVPID